jgi:hypothetical protein
VTHQFWYNTQGSDLDASHQPVCYNYLTGYLILNTVDSRSTPCGSDCLIPDATESESHLSARDVWRTGGGLNTPKFRSFAKAEPNSQFRGIYNVIRIWISFICKLSGTPDYGATALGSPFSLPSILNWICWLPPWKNSWPNSLTQNEN